MREIVKGGNGTFRCLVLIALITLIAIIVIAIGIVILTPAPVEQVQAEIALSPSSTQMEVGEKIQISVTNPLGLCLEWTVSDPELGSIERANNEEAVFTATKNGTVKISVTAPNTQHGDDIEIEIFTRPELKVGVADSLLEVNQLYKYTIVYTDDSVFISEIYITDELGTKVDALFPQNMLRLEKSGTYNLKVVGVTYKGNPIEAEASFSVLPKIEAVSGKPVTINLVSLAPSDIKAIEVFLKENLGLNVDLLRIGKEGELVKDADVSFIAVLFTRDNNEERVWIRTEVNAFDYYPKGRSFRTERIGSSKDGYVWTLGVDISPYTQQISCVMAFPSKGGYHLSNKGYLTSGSGYSDSGGSTGGGGGKKPSPDIPPDDPGTPSPPPEDGGGGGKPSPDIPPDDPGTPSPPPEDGGGGEQSPPPDDASPPPEGNGGGQSPDVPPDDPGMD